MFERNKQKISLLSGNQITVKSLSKIRCFWIWPFGHIWGEHPTDSDYFRQCVICKKTSFDRAWGYDLYLLNLTETKDQGNKYNIRYAKSKCSIRKIIKRYIVTIITIILIIICFETCNKYYQFIPDVGLVARPNAFSK